VITKLFLLQNYIENRKLVDWNQGWRHGVRFDPFDRKKKLLNLNISDVTGRFIENYRLPDLVSAVTMSVIFLTLGLQILCHFFLTLCRFFKNDTIVVIR
jgi:hypothetical protein